MLASNYSRRIVSICLVLLVLIVGLSVVLYNQGPGVRLVQFSDRADHVSLTKNTTMSIVFDRPLEQKDYFDLVSISPSLDFTAVTNAQNITLTFNENLSHNTDYTVTVSPGVYDRSGKQMQEQYKYAFSTASPSYAHIERNYDALIGSDDHIKMAKVGVESEIIFSRPEIRSFAVNRSHLVAAVVEAEQDTLFTIDLETREVRQDIIELGGRIHNLTLSPRGQIALFTVQPDFSSVSPEYYDSVANRIESLNVATGAITPITNEAGEYIKAFDILQDSSGQVALVQDQMQSYYAISPYNDYEPTLVGSYSTSFGFNDKASQIIFRDREDLVLYDITSAQVTPLSLGGNGYIQELSSSNGAVFVSSIEFLAGTSSSAIYKYEDWGSEAETVWKSNVSDMNTINGFTESYDTNLLAVQQNPASCSYDNIGINSQCTTVQTIIFDTARQEIIESFNGFDVVWIP